jgi:hypothetical protein
MTTAKQIAANRKNAECSTGPWAEAGRRFPAVTRSATPLTQTLTNWRQIVVNHIYNCILHAATVSALVDLLRVRKVRREMLATIDLGSASPAQLHRLFAIDRYESRARVALRLTSP